MVSQTCFLLVSLPSIQREKRRRRVKGRRKRSWRRRKKREVTSGKRNKGIKA